jgi:hypothetical protein
VVGFGFEVMAGVDRRWSAVKILAGVDGRWSSLDALAEVDRSWSTAQSGLKLIPA